MRLSKDGSNETSSAMGEGKVQVNIRLNARKANKFSSGVNGDSASSSSSTTYAPNDALPVHNSVSNDAGPLWDAEECPDEVATIIPHRGSCRKRVLVLCTGGTLTMSNDPSQGNSLAPVQGALTSYLSNMVELTEDPEMPEIVSHEYSPLIDSSDMGPGDWAMIARDIETNYYHFDGFVVLMGTVGHHQRYFLCSLNGFQFTSLL